ncbi:MAG: hypothetical protein IJY12_01400, partial [Clostridia bacterium]|nr:hypothetical protein [Clostridia bacterium]
MKESFRRKKKEIDRKLSERNCEHGADGNTIVNMTVKDDSNFLSVFSSGQAPVISTEVADFIENNTHTIRSNEELTLRIYGNCIDEQEKVTYGSAIKEYYAEKYLANEKELKRNSFIVLILMWDGILVLAAAIFLEYRRDSIIWSEVIDIMAWVFLWEAVDIAVFENRSLRLKRLRYMSYMS